ncbi:MAG: hypothetical protein D6B26_00965, partial [Spirochaetaceae bacterium]
TNTIKKMRNRRIVSEGLIGGALLIIGLYNLVLFLVRRSERLPLAFSAVCFVFGIYALFSGERLILLFFDIPFELFGKLWFFQYYIMVPAVAWFIHCLFPEDGRLPVYKGLAIFSAILAGLTFALPFSRGVDIFSVNHIATAATAVYLIVKIILALRRKREHALSFALAAAIFILATVNDILYSENLISTLRISSYGLLGFALAVSVMVSRRFASAYMQEEQSATSLRRYSRSLEELVGERTAELETQTNKLEDGIRYAKLIQDSVLPSMDSLKIILPECELFFRPRHIVGGDFYWAQAIEPGRGWLALGDCPGTGVTGALRVMRTISLLNNAITHENPAMKGINDPASIMSWLHGRRLEESSHNSSMDLLLIYWDNGDVKYASSRLGFFVRTKAGQDGIPPVHFFPGDKKSLGSPRTPGNHAFRQGNISLEAGDYMYLLTDGLLQQNGEDKPFPFGKRRMADLIQSIEGEGPKDHLFAISNGLNEYQQNMTQHDDNLLIIIRNI